jgi:signal transduction histidine kinase
LLLRPKLFLTFTAICIAPLLIISSIYFFSALKNSKTLLQNTLDQESKNAARQFENIINEREHELRTLASGPLSEKPPAAIAADLSHAPVGNAISNLPLSYSSLATFEVGGAQTLLAETSSGSWSFRNRDFIPGAISPDTSVWTMKPNAAHRKVLHDAKSGDIWRTTLPIFPIPNQENALPTTALVADLKLDQVFAAIDRSLQPLAQDAGSTCYLIVIDSEQRFAYHSTRSNQYVTAALPNFSQLATTMRSTKTSGSGQFVETDGDTWMVSYQPLQQGLSLAVARNYSVATAAARRAGWLVLGLSPLLGSLTGLIITLVHQRRTQSLHRVTASVAAIAEGKLDEDLLLRSSDDMRGLADSVNLVSEKLREQFAREAEMRQFNSFVKLSAMLAHDLKNAIHGLSLMVGNMERHFDNASFRAETMKALADSTYKLQMLVARLSNPVNTLSGEYVVPRPTDLVPLLKRVIEQIAEPKRELHQIKIDLPSSLFALVNGERMEKVMENLVLNAIEAMGNSPGRLTVTAGQAEDAKVFFSVSDTGPGMTSDFINQKLFRPFSTTKAQGIGLGLYTCREVVRTNNGEITVESVPGSGTTFRVVLAST